MDEEQQIAANEQIISKALRKTSRQSYWLGIAIGVTLWAYCRRGYRLQYEKS